MWQCALNRHNLYFGVERFRCGSPPRNCALSPRSKFSSFHLPPFVGEIILFDPKFFVKGRRVVKLKEPEYYQFVTTRKATLLDRVLSIGFGVKLRMGFPYQGDTLRESKTRGQVPTA